MSRISSFGPVILAMALVACGDPPQPPGAALDVDRPAACAATPGIACSGINDWIRFEPGELPLVISVPHGGTIEPADVPDRATGTVVTDRNTIELARAIANELQTVTGRRPHLIVSHLSRTKLDVNRDLEEAAQGQPAMVQAWTDYHGFIELAIEAVLGRSGQGFFLDVHGHAHPVDQVEWGYLLPVATLEQTDEDLDVGDAGSVSSLALLLSSSPDSFSGILRGPASLGGLLGPAMPSVPSPATPFPTTEYFTGGYTTRRHSRLMPGVQLEAHFRGLRETPVSRAAFAAALVPALRSFAARHLQVEF